MLEHQQNKIAWNQAATYYKESLPKSIEALRQGDLSFCPPEFPYLQDLKDWCGTAIHLQCAAGHDTLSLINLGAHKVIGVDISDEMIHLARQKTQALQMNAEWYVSDILNTPHNLDNTADLVYTGRGAINWMMDIQAWAKVVARLLKKGGKFYIFEGHPITIMFDELTNKFEVSKEYKGYFSDRAYTTDGWSETYVGEIDELKKNTATKYDKPWPIYQVMNALLESGLTLLKFEEHPDAYYGEFPHLSEEERSKFPNTFSMLFVK